MKSYFLKIGLRNLLKNSSFSLINIFGLAAGITAFLLIFSYVRYEKSYDRQHQLSERIYRLRYERSSAEGESVKFASCCPPAAIRIRELYPEVEMIARVFRYRATVIFGDRKFYEERMFFAEPQIFDVFDIGMVTGDPSSGISSANTAFISESCARKYFGSSDPMGQTINVDREMSFVVTGIFRDFPGNSHIKMDIMLSWPNLLTHYGPDIEMSWGDTGFFTYLVLNQSADPQVFEEKLRDLVEKDFGEVLRYYKLTLDLKVQPLTDIHLNSSFMQELEVNGNRDTVTLLSIIAFFILIIAWVNYINITTARSMTRAKEVGLSKAVGSSRMQLMSRFFVETVLVNFAAMAISMVFIAAAWPSFSDFTGIPSGDAPWQEGWFWITSIVLFACSVVLSGTYPVLVLTSFKTSETLRGRYVSSGSGIVVRKALVTFQFVMAISLITCTILVFRQVEFFRKQDRGIETRNVLAVRAPRVRDEAFGNKLLTFKEELLKNQAIEMFSVGTEVPGRQILWDAGGIFRVGSDQSKNYQIIGMDYDYLPLLGAEIVAGRNFDRSFSDSSSLILNETAVRWMGFESPEEAVNQKVNYWGNIYSVAGVVKDYRQQSPKEEFEPHIFRFMPHGRDVRGFFMIRYLAGNEKQVTELVSSRYAEFFPDNPFDYFFLDDYYEQQYHQERLLGSVFGIFALLAVIITCLGILGLTSFMMLQKKKEISIRKVVGSDTTDIIALFSRDFVVLITVSFIISAPLCWLWVTGWLRNYPVKMDISAWSFIVPFLVALAIALVTIGLLVRSTALESPARNLRVE
ncbi:MAG: FtsX-like permease family protein [Bacteroidetes bacterium]|nr:MAG: FtsX-like permease family protein [Bacteroidota bacterium]